MKHVKKVSLVFAVVMALSVPIGVYAATSDSDVATSLRGFCGLGIDTSNLTQEQKEELDASCNEIMEIKKESINKMVQDEIITQEQGDQAVERINDMEAYHEENGYGTGMMNGSGNCQGSMGNAQHVRGNCGNY